VVDIVFGESILAEELAGCIGSIDFEPVRRTAICGDEANIVEHGSGIKKLGVELQSASLPYERSEAVDAAGVVEQQTGLGIADERGDVLSELAVGNVDRLGGRNGCGHWGILLA
jgi:hypothetical protein